MQIAVLSGKGGTGKTFISVNLACVIPNSIYVDCDVEEPNGHLFFQPKNVAEQPVYVTVPQVKPEQCTLCRRCVDFCRYNALALIKDKLLVFQEICHSCGGCTLFCPTQALSEKERSIGVISRGASGAVDVRTGCLNMGEASGVPIIKGLLRDLPADGNVIIDCPPGSACIVMESIRQADYCLLVAEPTLFGVHNLALVYELVCLLQKPLGLVINKSLPGENPVKDFCHDKNIKILAEIPYDDKLGNLIAEGRVAVRENEHYRQLFSGLGQALRQEVVS